MTFIFYLKGNSGISEGDEDVIDMLDVSLNDNLILSSIYTSRFSIWNGRGWNTIHVEMFLVHWWVGMTYICTGTAFYDKRPTIFQGFLSLLQSANRSWRFLGLWTSGNQRGCQYIIPCVEGNMILLLLLYLLCYSRPKSVTVHSFSIRTTQVLPTTSCMAQWPLRKFSS